MHLSFWLFSRQVVSDSLGPLGLQHARLPLSFTISHSLLKVMSIELVMPSNHLILCCLLLLLPSIFPSIRVFSSESALRIMWPEYWSSESLQPHKLQHTRLLCSPLSPRVCLNSCLLHQPSRPLLSSSPFSCIRELFSSEYSGLVSFRIDWFGLLAVQGTRKSLLQQHSLKVSVLRHLAFFMVYQHSK